MQNTISIYRRTNSSSRSWFPLGPQQHLHVHWQKLRNSDEAQTSCCSKTLSWWATTWSRDRTRSMTSIQRMDREHARGSSIKWNAYVKYLKLIVLLATTENNSQRHTRCSTRMAVCVTWLRSWIQHRKGFHICGSTERSMYSRRKCWMLVANCFNNSKWYKA